MDCGQYYSESCGNMLEMNSLLTDPPVLASLDGLNVGRHRSTVRDESKESGRSASESQPKDFNRISLSAANLSNEYENLLRHQTNKDGLRVHGGCPDKNTDQELVKLRLLRLQGSNEVAIQRQRPTAQGQELRRFEHSLSRHVASSKTTVDDCGENYLNTKTTSAELIRRMSTRTQSADRSLNDNSGYAVPWSTSKRTSNRRVEVKDGPQKIGKEQRLSMGMGSERSVVDRPLPMNTRRSAVLEGGFDATMRLRQTPSNTGYNSNIQWKTSRGTSTDEIFC